MTDVAQSVDGLSNFERAILCELLELSWEVRTAPMVARKLGQPRRTVHYHMAKLREKGWLKGGRRVGNGSCWGPGPKLDELAQRHLIGQARREGVSD